MNASHRFALAVDLDGVVADYHHSFSRFCSDQLGFDTANRPAPSTWNYSTSWPDVFSTTDDYREAHRGAVQHGLFEQMTPIPGAVEALQRLSDAEIHIRIVTSRLLLNGQHAVVAGQTIAWLDRVGVPYRSLALERDDKRHIRAELAVDDAPHNVLAWRSVGVPCVVFDQPYNRHVPDPRVLNWEQMERLVLDTAARWQACS